MTQPPEPATFPLGPALDFLQRIWRLNHALERLSIQMEKRIGITAQQRLLIRCVGKFPGITAGQLATVLHVDPGTISSTVRRLEQKRLVERQRDPKDNRRVTLGLTRSGRALDVPTDGTAEAGVQNLFLGVDPHDAAMAISTLDKFTTILENKVGSKAAHKTPRNANSP